MAKGGFGARVTASGPTKTKPVKKKPKVQVIHRRTNKWLNVLSQGR